MSPDQAQLLKAQLQAQLQALQQLSVQVNDIADLEKSLDKLVHGLQEALDLSNVSIYLIDPPPNLDAKKDIDGQSSLAAQESNRLGLDLHLAAVSSSSTFDDDSQAVVDLEAPIVQQIIHAQAPNLEEPEPIKDVDGKFLLNVQESYGLGPISFIAAQEWRETTSSLAPNTLAVVAFPIRIQGHLIGLLVLESDQETHTFAEATHTALLLLVNQIAAILQARHLYRQSQNKTENLEKKARNMMLINRLSTMLNASLDAYEVLKMTSTHLVEFSGADYGHVLILGQEQQRGQVIVEHPTSQLKNQYLPLPHSPSIQRMLISGMPYAVEDVSESPLLSPLNEHLLSLNPRSALLVPLIARRELIGLLILLSRKASTPFSDEKIEICQTIASQAATAVANARLLQDIQRQKRALARKSQEMTEQSSKLDAILNNIADGLVVTDPSGRIILSNPAFQQMTDLPPHQLNGRLLLESFSDAGLPQLLKQALEMPHQAFTDDLVLPNGRVFKASSTALSMPPPIMSLKEDERIAGVVTVFRDITHEVEVDRIKTEFISTVSHALRTPLTAILGFANLIQRDFDRWIRPQIEGEKAQQIAQRISENLRIVENESNKLGQLVCNFVDLSKMESGDAAWPTTLVDVSTVIQKGVTATAAFAEEKGVPIRVHFPEQGLASVWGNEDRLFQVITSLIVNAIKSTDDGVNADDGDDRYVELSVLRWRTGPEKDETFADPPTDLQDLPPGDWLVVNVTDTGAGVRPEDVQPPVAHIFQKFTRATRGGKGKAQSANMGLPLCKSIIERHDGKTWIKRKVGEESTFSFSFALPIPDEPEPKGITDSKFCTKSKNLIG
ncbi:MAG TPA: GAF domain-containing protein [Chloroflexi bacterium]|nr:GAF domain-containing protein [Chloroflexota bacterium]